MMSIKLPSLILWVCLLLTLVASPVSTTGDETRKEAGSSSQPVSVAAHDGPSSHLVSYEDILQRRFRHTDTEPARESHPDTFLFADPPQSGWAPILDLTHPQPYSSLNSLIHRYRHLHIYRTFPNAPPQSHIILLQRDLRKPPLLTDGNRIHNLNERINSIEHIKNRYGREVAWARFHQLFTPIPGPENMGPTWEEIVRSDFVPTYRWNRYEIRNHMNNFRLGKFWSLDGKSWLGITINSQGVAHHHEEEFSEEEELLTRMRRMRP